MHSDANNSLFFIYLLEPLFIYLLENPYPFTNPPVAMMFGVNGHR